MKLGYFGEYCCYCDGCGDGLTVDYDCGCCCKLFNFGENLIFKIHSKFFYGMGRRRIDKLPKNSRSILIIITKEKNQLD